MGHERPEGGLVAEPVERGAYELGVASCGSRSRLGARRLGVVGDLAFARNVARLLDGLANVGRVPQTGVTPAKDVAVRQRRCVLPVSAARSATYLLRRGSVIF